MTPQQNASMALAEWQSLKRRYPDPGKRADVFDALMRDFFSRDREYDDQLRVVEQEMASDA